MGLLLLACTSPSKDVSLGDPEETASHDTADTGDSVPVETGDSPVETGESEDSETAVDDSDETEETQETGDPEVDWLVGVDLQINLGDSVAAGYDARDDGGYAWLLHLNDGDHYPEYDGHDLFTVAGAAVKHIAESGATSGDVLANLRDANLPSASGTVVVTLSAGGNDFNDSIYTMLSEDLTLAAAAVYRQNLADIVDHLRANYADVRVYVANIQDPTDGLGTIPDGYSEGMCEFISTYGPYIGTIAVDNLGVFNDEIAAEVAELGAGVELVDYHGWFFGHGLNSNDGWISDDCAHPTSEGHHQIRRLVWEQWTGDLY